MHLVKKYFPRLSNPQIDLLFRLESLYREWNSKINLISRKDTDNIMIRHILPSLAVSKAVSFAKSGKALDIGTGGGLPGIPLSILFPQTDFLLIDSIGKKTKTVNEIIRSLGLKNVHCEQARSNEMKEKFDYVLGRAVKKWPEFRKLAGKNLKPGGKIIYLSGGEMVPRENEKIFSLGEWFEGISDLSEKNIIVYEY